MDKSMQIIQVSDRQKPYNIMLANLILEKLNHLILQNGFVKNQYESLLITVF